ncbi:MAG: hypothetical protein ABIS18_06885 [Actinomycetota bacterium]
MERARFWRPAVIGGPLLVAVAVVAVIAAPGPPRRLLARPMPDSQSPMPTTHPKWRELVDRPNSGRVNKGVSYRFPLSTHCGLDYDVDFDGSHWDYAGPYPSEDGNAKAWHGFDDPFDYGTMKLISEGIAEYRGASGSIVRFHRRDNPKMIPGCM